MSMLKDKIKNFPKIPGVYQFIGESGEILYVGKAKNLQNRLKSYFAREIGRGLGIDLMVQQAKDIKIYETESEIEAVILEADLIGKLKPKYNIRQKDDKSFLAIKITKPKSRTWSVEGGTDITAPNPSLERRGIQGIDPSEISCVGLVRFRDVDLADKSAWYFGPYPSGELLKKSMRYLRRIFPFRDCSDRKFVRYSSFNRKCLYGDIGICPGVCVGENVKTEYQKNVKLFIDFLRGKKGKIVKDLEKEMAKLSRAKKFEQASILRDRLKALGHLKDVAIGIKDDVATPTSILFKRIECYDISNIQGEYAVGSMVVFEGGEPNKNEYRKFKIRGNRITFNSNEALTLPYGFRGASRIDTPAICSFSEGWSLAVPAGRQVTDKRLTQDASQGDLQMMEEMLRRRFHHTLHKASHGTGNNWPLPNLIIIDGGLVHLNLTRKILGELKLDISVVSIAKGPGRKKNEFHFANQSIAQYFHSNVDLQRVAVKARNEAHRFAIEYYRKLHRKDLLNS